VSFSPEPAIAALAVEVSGVSEPDLEHVRGVLCEVVASERGSVAIDARDRILCLFGSAPLGEQCLRAVRAALLLRKAIPAMNEEYGLRASLRAGIHAGPPGDALEVARALWSLARPGAVVASKAVERLVPRRFRCRELDPVVLPGRGEAIVPYEMEQAIGGQADFEECGPRPAPFVGRQREMRSLEEAVRARRPVAVVGPPGSGRGRLLSEVRTRARENGAWAAAGRVLDRPRLPFAPFAEIARAEAAVSGMDRGDPERLFAALHRDLAAAGLSEEDAGRQAERIVLSLGAPLPAARGDGDAEETLHAWRCWIASRSTPPGSVLCVEGLSSADAPSLALLQSLAADPSRPALFATAVPGAMPPAGFSVLELPGLPPGDALALAEDVSGGPTGAELAALVRDQTSGHALHVDALARATRLSGRPTRSPLHVLLGEEIDSLPPDTRTVVCAAAVLGTTFWHFFLSRLLVREVRSALAEAVGRGVLLTQPSSLMRNDGLYRFRHPLLAEAALERLEAAERRKLHAEAAALFDQRVRHGGLEPLALAAAHASDAGDQLGTLRRTQEGLEEASRRGLTAWEEVFRRLRSEATA
jgi:hypothetical protein